MTIVGLYNVFERHVPELEAAPSPRPAPSSWSGLDVPLGERSRRRRIAAGHPPTPADVWPASSFHDLQRTLMGVLLERGDVHDLVRAAAPALDALLLVLGPDGEVVARSGREALRVIDGTEPAQRSRGVDVAAVLKILPDPLLGPSLPPVWEMTRGAIEERVWVAPLMAGEDNLGWLLASTDGQCDLEPSLVERVAEAVALLLLHQRSLALMETEVRGELLEDLLSPTPGDIESLARRAALVPLHLDRPHAVLVADALHLPRAALAGLDAELTRALRGCHGWYDEHLVLLVPADAAEKATAMVSSLLLRLAGRPIALGTAGPTAGPSDFSRCFQEAVRYLKAHEIVGRQGGVASKCSLGLYGLIAGAADPALFGAFLTGTVGPLLSYDRERRTDLVRTLRTYLRETSNHTRTAQALCIHPNTLYRRLDRITELLGEDWRQHDRSLEIHVALRFEDMVRPELARSATTPV